jgi:hypothetical protein
MNVPLKLFLIMLSALILSACGSRPPKQNQQYQQSYSYTPAYKPIYTQSYNNTPAYKPAPARVTQAVQYAPARSTPVMSFEDLIRFEYDCSRRIEQIDFLQDQLRKKTFYRVDGVEGNEFPDRINKRYYALAKFRIWNLRLGCQGSNVEKMTEVSMKARAPTRPPESMPRCYFEESVVAKTHLNQTQGAAEEVVSKRKEFCTNYPLIADKKSVFIGDAVDPERQLDKSTPYMPNLRKWNGNIFQMASKTEIHQRDVVKFTVVLMWNGAGWVVADKF